MKIPLMVLMSLMLIPSGSPLAPQKDVPAEVNAARTSLQNAHNELERAGGDWGGHRNSAMKHIDEALTELNEAEKWARDHHEMK